MGTTTRIAGVIFAVLLSASTASAKDEVPAKETDCKNRIDDDQDSLPDCADADCYADAFCKTAGGLENNNAACSDFIDNDSDDAKDCDDADCQASSVTVCQGSWKGSLDGTGTGGGGGGGGGGGNNNQGSDVVPDLKEGMSVEDLLGKGSDADGERNEFLCSDGLDNDGDGAADCADLGCRFDPDVTVCRGTPGIRFSLGAHVRQSYDFDTKVWDTVFNRLQLRAFGPLPFIQDSFFLLSIRAEQAPRLVFATVNLPIAAGHSVSINSGGGGLSNLGILSVSKNLMLDPAFYLTNAFERGNGAAFEVAGPVVGGLMDYRVFGAGGSGEFNGSIGGRFFRGTDRNYTWAVGGQAAFYLVGRFDRWDTRYLYTEAGTAFTAYVGARYDQREAERFPAANVALMFRSGRFLATAEGWGKRELNFGSWQFAYNAMVGVLIWPKLLLFGADFGGFYATEFDEVVPDTSTLRRLGDELQWRLALHCFVWRNTGLLSVLYTDRFVEATVVGAEDTHTHEIRLEAQIRF